MRAQKTKRRGQALVMVTLALLAMFGLIGLLVDFGYGFFLEKMMQNAADAAALAAVRAVIDSGGGLGSYTCGGSAVCAASPISCASATGNLQAGCQYALQNGFDWTAANTSVTVQASDRNTPPTVVGCSPAAHHPPTAPCVDTYYWVTVRIARNVPQLFSAIWGNGVGTVSARATAAIAQSRHGRQPHHSQSRQRPLDRKHRHGSGQHGQRGRSRPGRDRHRLGRYGRRRLAARQLPRGGGFYLDSRRRQCSASGQRHLGGDSHQPERQPQHSIG